VSKYAALEPFSQQVDLLRSHVHIRPMDFDISHLLDQWDYHPGQVVVRRFKAKDGKEKIQLRVDLGILQMNVEGRPDGKRPYGHSSLYDYFQSRLYKYVAAHAGSDEGFSLKAEDCAKLQVEALQYHQRYFCLLQLEDYAGVVRDSERNLAVFEFVARHAESEDVSWPLQQFKPQLLMVLTRARASQSLQGDDFEVAIQQIEEGTEQIREFFREHGRADMAEQSGEVLSLEAWLEEIRSKRPLTAREKLERALTEAIQREQYERAAELRDKLQKLKRSER
jgi:UvrB/uvrC motif